MNHISVPDGNTPIFNQLAAERGYDPKFPDHLVRPFQFRSAGILQSEQTNSEPIIPLRLGTPYMSPGAWIAKPVPRMSPETKRRNASLKVNVHPEEAMHVNTYGMEGFIQARINEFNEKHPNAVDVVVSTKNEIDGTVTILIEGYEIPGVILAKKPVWPAAAEPKGESFIIRGLAETLPPVIRVEPKTEEIPDELSARQLALYRAAVVSSNTIATSEQTGDHANAASTDESRPQNAIPRPLWISDEEVADEE